MKLIIGLVLITVACAEFSPQLEYLPPINGISHFVEANSPSNEYLAPTEDQITLADDGYRYKTVRRLRNRKRRDVSELTSAHYLPPYEEATQNLENYAPSNEYLATVEEQTVLADDGYRYKTIRRLRNRKRRDVNELSGAQYLPPYEETTDNFQFNAPSNEYLPPNEEHTVLANDGYRYKTVRRFRNRKRRDVSELTSGQYLPPHLEVSQSLDVITPPSEYVAPIEQHTVIDNDGYRYKTVKKFKIRRQ